MLPVGDEPSGSDRLLGMGFETREEGGKIVVDNVVFASNAEKAGVDFDQEIVNVQMAASIPPKQLLFIPALVLFAGVYAVQRRRARKEQTA